MAEDKPENPPAFPLSPGDVPHYESGMTLRDYFAGQALIGLLSTFTVKDVVEMEGQMETLRLGISIDAYQYADAMLKERAKT